MKRLFLCSVVVASVSLGVGGICHAQAVMAGDSAFIELLRSDIKKQRTTLITKVMELSVDDAAAFWPLYRDFRAQMDQLGDAHVELIREYAKNYWNLSDDKAREIGNKWYAMRQRELELRRQYFGALSDVLSPAQALKVMQLEHRVDLLISLQIANELPMIE